MDAHRSTIAAYRAHAELFEKRLTARHRVPPFLRRIAARLPRGARVLDLGCGTGHDALYLAKRGCTVIAVDATEVFAKKARRRCAGRNVRVVRSDMGAYAFPRGAFDLVWANASLIHVPKKRLPALLARIRSSLRPGGILAATIHNGRREGVHPGTWIPGRFFASYLKEELARIVEGAGFHVVELRGAVNEDRRGRWLNIIAD